MTKTPTVLAASLLAALALTACGAANDETPTPAAPTPPIVSETDTQPPEPPAAPVADTDAHNHGDESHDEDEHHDHDTHAEDDHDEHDHDDGVGEAHVHGLSEMAMIVDGNTLSISFGGPLVNVLGFEHEAKTPEQEQAVSDLKETLADVSNLVAIPTEAGCNTLKRDVSIRVTGTHGTINVEYDLECTKVTAVREARVTGFDTFSGLETIDAIVITPAGQSAVSLTASSNTIAFPE